MSHRLFKNLQINKQIKQTLNNNHKKKINQTYSKIILRLKEFPLGGKEMKVFSQLPRARKNYLYIFVIKALNK